MTRTPPAPITGPHAVLSRRKARATRRTQARTDRVHRRTMRKLHRLMRRQVYLGAALERHQRRVDEGRVREI